MSVRRRAALIVSSTSTATGNPRSPSPAPSGQRTRSGRCSSALPPGPIPRLRAPQRHTTLALVATQLTLAEHAMIGIAALQGRGDSRTGNQVQSAGGAHATWVEPPQTAPAHPRSRDRIQAPAAVPAGACATAIPPSRALPAGRARRPPTHPRDRPAPQPSRRQCAPSTAISPLARARTAGSVPSSDLRGGLRG